MLITEVYGTGEAAVVRFPARPLVLPLYFVNLCCEMTEKVKRGVQSPEESHSHKLVRFH